MQAGPLPDDVRRFVLTSVPSVPYLEAMLLLRDHPGLPFDADALAQRLYVVPAKAQEILEALLASGVATRLAAERNTCVYAPASPVLAERIDALKNAYAKNLIEITHLIHDATSRSAQQLSEAFRWRRSR